MASDPWPPADAVAYAHSVEFGNLILSVTEELSQRYPSIDFSDATATVFVWFDKRVVEDPGFLTSGRFPGPASFRAYLRQSLWNAARGAERSRRRREDLRDPDAGLDLLTEDLALPVLADLHECLDRLPLDLRVVFEHMLREDDPPGGTTREEWASATLELGPAEVERRYAEACERIAKCLAAP